MNPRTAWLQAAGGAVFVSAGLLLATLTVSGCGGNGGSKTDASAQNGGSRKSPRSPDNVRPANDGDNIAAVRPHRGVWMNHGQKYYNKHPYDVWYAHPYQVAADNRPIGGVGNGNTVVVVPKSKSPKQPVEKKAAPQAAGDWKSIVSGADLEAEMKRIANFCKEKVLTAARYNASFKEIHNNACALAAIAQVAARHPDPVSWKADALYLRDLGLALANEAQARGTAKFRSSKELFEQIDGILRKNKPAGLKEPKQDATFFDVAARGGLMRRMEAAHKWLKTEIKTEEKFKAQAQTIAHEATMLGLMAKVVGDKSYDSADDPEYKKYVATTVEETRKIVSATKTGNFAAFQPAVDKIFNQCTACHGAFR